MNNNLSYILVYAFDQENIDMKNAKVFCSDTEKHEYYTHFLNNEQTFGYNSIVYGIPELVENEVEEYCSNRTVDFAIQELLIFTKTYRFRAYQSTCYYLTSNNQWRTDGLIVCFAFFRFAYTN